MSDAQRSIVPARITLALDARGLYGPEVDVACGGVEPMVDQWEAGVRTPTDDQLQRLAALTGMFPDWFRQPYEEPRGVAFLCSRTGRGRGCQVVHTGPDADVIELAPTQGALW